jgi:stress-induced morphogen
MDMSPNQIEAKIKAALPESDFIVTDLTGTENHYEVRVASSAFKGKSRIERQRIVMDIFAAELKTGEVHALSIQTLEKDY